MRVLHLLDSDADYDTQQSVRVLLRTGERFEIDMETVGRGGTWRGPVDAVLKRRIRHMPHTLHAWGCRSLVIGALVPHRRLLFTPTGDNFAKTARCVRAVMPHREMRTITHSEFARRELIHHGVPADSIDVVLPGIDFAHLPPRKDQSLRDRLGIKADDRVFIAVGDSHRDGGHEDIAWGISILAAMDRRYKLLISGRGVLASKLGRLFDRVKQPGTLVDGSRILRTDIGFDALCGAANGAIASPNKNLPATSLATAMAMGLPVISTATYASSEFLQDRTNALLVTSSTPRQIARRILDLEEDASQAWRIGDAARSDAYRIFSVSRFRRQHATLWRGEPLTHEAGIA